jgi:hypothetical protein
LASAGFASPGLESLFFESGFDAPVGPGPDDPVGGVAGGAEAPFVNRGGSSPEPDCPVDCGELEGVELEGAELEAGVPEAGVPEAGAVVEAGAATFVGSLVSRGGSSLLSMPTGAVSAFSSVLAVSLPPGTHLPVAIHGI